MCKHMTIFYDSNYQTIASRYKNLIKRVYAIFVKASDSFCRQASFLKLAKSGITGTF